MTFVYVEKEVQTHPRTLKVLEKLKPSHVIPIDRYPEIFNRKNQHFRLQKKQASFILAKKHGTLIYPTPPGYGIGAKHNYYFSHFLNCPFDCRYCFLQGMYRSASFVLFVNFEEFQEEIKEKMGEDKATFFSGYDGDSLAMDAKTGFLSAFLPFFRKHPNAELELRTKSVFIRELLKQTPFPNCVVAFSLSPQPLIQELEKKTPPLVKRLEAIQKLQEAGWKIGLRFDPIIDCDNFEYHYTHFFEKVFAVVDETLLHSVSLGAFRLPKPVMKEMKRLKPHDSLLAINQEGPRIQEKLRFCHEKLLNYFDKRKLFVCAEEF
ncbi:SPL family radical SAM protein [Simkania negevensis]|uniref:Putative DNA repair photolyase n=1 Tax=Simkania negevensis (strain ATCC VR-1471 / DSM 27360 / Z) TaxID=331113 RepID=F8L9R9_SIMNZ|nr:radical SAM protein [Simkania negevensis]CCB89614.1 putative DNA repair photolyase [Simkania negevensis Z]